MGLKSVHAYMSVIGTEALASEPSHHAAYAVVLLIMMIIFEMCVSQG